MESISKADPNGNKGPLVVRVCIVCICLSGLAVCLRFVSRKLVRQPFLWDDWMIVIAIPFAWANCINEIIAVKIGGYGRHSDFATPQTIAIFFKLLYAVQIFYSFAIAFIKFSLLLFYRRIFSIHQTRLPAIIIAAIVLAWLIATVLLGIFSCKPIHGFWDIAIHSECIDPLKFYIGVAVPNILTDAVLLIFPIPLIWKLHVPISQKLAILVIFVLGGFIIIVSSLRLGALAATQGDTDMTWALVPLGIWNVVETNIGIILACLPSMLPILRLLLGQKLKPTNDNNTPTSRIKRRKLWSSSRTSHSDRRSFTRLNDLPSAKCAGVCGQTVTVSTGENQDEVELQETRVLPGIHVRRDIEWGQ